MSRFLRMLIISVLASPAIGLAQSDDGNVYNSQQATARPFGLDVIDLVQTRGTDAASQSFLENELPSLSRFIDRSFQERVMLGNHEAISVDPTKLKLATDAEVRTYFVTEGAGYHNTLGFNVNANGIEGDNAKLIFPDASSREQYYDPNASVRRTRRFPVLPGDFVDLGTFSAGDQLDFFMIADGARGGENVYGFDSASNPDGLQHSVAFTYAAEDSPYLVIGFEDLLGGGDQDFNDLVFVVDIGRDNARKLISAPEPGFFAAVGIAGAACWRRRKKRASCPSKPQIAHSQSYHDGSH